MDGIVIENLSKYYGNQAVVKNVNLEIADTEFVTLLGPSGCGKTTTLRLIAGFLKPDTGTIRVGGAILSSKDDRPAAGETGHGDGLPDLRHLAPPDRLSECRLRSGGASSTRNKTPGGR